MSRVAAPRAIRWLALALAALAVISPPMAVRAAAKAPAVAVPAGKRLIEMGWDEPDPRFMRTHLAQLLASPFDGCVYHVNYRTARGDSGNFTWELWGRRRFTAAELAEADSNLRATDFGRFRDVFLRVNVTPGEMDWFEDHSAVMANLELAARLARTGGGPGILLDVEMYRGALWDYREQVKRHPRTWAAMCTQVRKRGAEAMRSLERGYPGLTVFTTWAYSLSLDETVGNRVPLERTRHALLPAFLDGMLSAASPRVVLVEGHEGSYPYRAHEQFKAKADSVRHNVPRLTRDPARYARHLSLAFGLWLDHDWRHLGWDTLDVARNHFSPAAFGTSVRSALEYSDRYVWIYSETPRWWTPMGTPTALPTAYDSTLRAAIR